MTTFNDMPEGAREAAGVVDVVRLTIWVWPQHKDRRHHAVAAELVGPCEFDVRVNKIIGVSRDGLGRKVRLAEVMDVAQVAGPRQDYSPSLESAIRQGLALHFDLDRARQITVPAEAFD